MSASNLARVSAALPGGEGAEGWPGVSAPRDKLLKRLVRRLRAQDTQERRRIWPEHRARAIVSIGIGERIDHAIEDHRPVRFGE